MNTEDFPGLYRSANQLSLESQDHFLRALRAHLALLVAAAALSVINYPSWWAAALQALILLLALACALYLMITRPERTWYTGRAIAESIKTITWRFVCRAEPFHTDEAQARATFVRKVGEIIDQNPTISQLLVGNLTEAQVTPTMLSIRSRSLVDRSTLYAADRITDQLNWYAGKAATARTRAKQFFALIAVTNVVAVIFSLVRIRYPSAPFWPTDIFVALSACLISWMQARRYSELSSSYALAAHEINLIRDSNLAPDTEKQFSQYVGDTENAFSREHTQWVARKDEP